MYCFQVNEQDNVSIGSLLGTLLHKVLTYIQERRSFEVQVLVIYILYSAIVSHDDFTIMRGKILWETFRKKTWTDNIISVKSKTSKDKDMPSGCVRFPNKSLMLHGSVHMNRNPAYFNHSSKTEFKK